MDDQLLLRDREWLTAAQPFSQYKRTKLPKIAASLLWDLQRLHARSLPQVFLRFHRLPEVCSGFVDLNFANTTYLRRLNLDALILSEAS